MEGEGLGATGRLAAAGVHACRAQVVEEEGRVQVQHHARAQQSPDMARSRAQPRAHEHSPALAAAVVVCARRERTSVAHLVGDL